MRPPADSVGVVGSPGAPMPTVPISKLLPLAVRLGVMEEEEAVLAAAVEVSEAARWGMATLSSRIQRNARRGPEILRTEPDTTERTLKTK